MNADYIEHARRLLKSGSADAVLDDIQRFLPNPEAELVYARAAILSFRASGRTSILEEAQKVLKRHYPPQNKADDEENCLSLAILDAHVYCQGSVINNHQSRELSVRFLEIFKRQHDWFAILALIDFWMEMQLGEVLFRLIQPFRLVEPEQVLLTAQTDEYVEEVLSRIVAAYASLITTAPSMEEVKQRWERIPACMTDKVDPRVSVDRRRKQIQALSPYFLLFFCAEKKILHNHKPCIYQSLKKYILVTSC